MIEQVLHGGQSISLRQSKNGFVSIDHKDNDGIFEGDIVLQNQKEIDWLITELQKFKIKEKLMNINQEALEIIKEFVTPITLNGQYNFVHTISALRNHIYKNMLQNCADAMLVGKNVDETLKSIKATEGLEDVSEILNRFMVFVDETLPDDDCIMFYKMGNFLETGVLEKKDRMEFEFKYDGSLPQGDNTMAIPQINVKECEGEFPNWLTEGKSALRYTFTNYNLGE